jgi:hypothetical protein
VIEISSPTTLMRRCIVQLLGYQSRMLSNCSRQAWSRAATCVARQSKQVTQRQSTIHPMVEQGLAGKLVSSPKPPEAGAQRVRLYGSLTTRHHNCRMQLPLDEAHQRQ